MYIFGLYVSYEAVMLGLIAVFFISLIASGKVQRTFVKYNGLPGQRRIPAYEAAQEMLSTHNSQVSVTRVSGSLTDHYDPTKGQVGLSTDVHNSTSVAALAIAAHEVGHVLQHEEGYSLMSFRNTLLPVARIGSSAGPYIAIIGMMISSHTLASIGLGLYCAMFLFQLVTLPVELDASRRGLALLQEGGYVSREDEPAAKKMLKAAAMTYVWAAVSSFLSVLRLAIMVNGGKRRRD